VSCAVIGHRFLQFSLILAGQIFSAVSTALTFDRLGIALGVGSLLLAAQPKPSAPR